MRQSIEEILPWRIEHGYAISFSGQADSVRERMTHQKGKAGAFPRQRVFELSSVPHTLGWAFVSQRLQGAELDLANSFASHVEAVTCGLSNRPTAREKQTRGLIPPCRSAQVTCGGRKNGPATRKCDRCCEW